MTRDRVARLLAQPITLTRERLYVLIAAWVFTAVLVTTSITR